MKSIETECKYTPKIIFKIATKHAKKVELLSHWHMHKHRRQEVFGENGACNSGKACSIQHREWFAVDVDPAQLVVESWVRWMSNRPYDEDGNLKWAWAEQIKGFDLAAPGDKWTAWTAWTMIVLPKDTVRVKREVPVTTAKNEDGTMMLTVRRDVEMAIKEEEEEDVRIKLGNTALVMVTEVE